MSDGVFFVILNIYIVGVLVILCLVIYVCHLSCNKLCNVGVGCEICLIIKCGLKRQVAFVFDSDGVFDNKKDLC